MTLNITVCIYYVLYLYRVSRNSTDTQKTFLRDLNFSEIVGYDFAIVGYGLFDIRIILLQFC